jgi:hypothetical protein
MKNLIGIAALAASCLAVATPAMAQRGPNSGGSWSQQQPSADDARFEAAQQRFANEFEVFRQETERYQQSRRAQWDDRRYNNDPRYNGGRWDDRDEGNYDPSQYYREGPRYRERVLATDERVYRGRDGKYYCKRSDGTTGLIVGAAAGGLFGNVIDGGHSRTAGTLIGAAIGAAVGASIERNQNEVRCR